MIRAYLLLVLAALPAALAAQSIQATTPMLAQNTPAPTTPAPDFVAYVVRADHPAFATLPAAIDFGSSVLAFARTTSTERNVALIITFSDDTRQQHFVTIRAKLTAQNWIQVCHISIGNRIVKNITLAPVTLGAPAPVTYAP
jgi:hypothetical protein